MAIEQMTLDDIQRICKAVADRGSVDDAYEWLRSKGHPYTRRDVRHVAREKRVTTIGEEPDGRAFDPFDPIIRSGMVKRLRKGWASLNRLCVDHTCSTEAMRDLLDNLDSHGYRILWDGNRVRIARGVPTPRQERTELSALSPDKRTFGILGDTHLCSHYERLDVLEDAYDHYAKLGIKTVFHTGNIVDGHTTFNEYEIYAHGITDQTEYLLDHYPQREGMKTYFICGACHEGWWAKREGIDIGEYIMLKARDRGRDDLEYLGFGEADIKLTLKNGKYGIVRLMHPGGGSAYAHSYATQRIIQSLQGGEKPGVLGCGHFHKAIYHVVRNVHVFQTGTGQDQTPWMRGKKIEAHVGFGTMDLWLDGNGAIRRFRPEFTGYYDKGYHVKLVEGE